jgi:hypothetical protein
MSVVSRAESTPGSNTTGPVATVAPQRTPRQKPLDKVLEAVRAEYARVTALDRDAVTRMLTPRSDGAAARFDVTPTMAAVLVTNAYALLLGAMANATDGGETSPNERAGGEYSNLMR